MVGELLEGSKLRFDAALRRQCEICLRNLKKNSKYYKHKFKDKIKIKFKGFQKSLRQHVHVNAPTGQMKRGSKVCAASLVEAGRWSCRRRKAWLRARHLLDSGSTCHVTQKLHDIHFIN